MIDRMLRSIASCLPLKIDVLEWSNPTFWMAGPGWTFNSLSSWRVIDNEKVLYACSDDFSKDSVKDLVGQVIVEVARQSSHLSVDPVFVLSTGLKLEVFATDVYEPWTMRLPNGEIYVASPGDPHAFD